MSVRRSSANSAASSRRAPKLERRLAQVAADIAREAEHLADAGAALVRLADETRSLEQAGLTADAVRKDAAVQAEAAAAEVASAEAGLQQMTEACATGDARRAALARQRRELAERQARLQGRLAESERQREPLLGALVSSDAIAAAAAVVTTAAADIERDRASATAAAQALSASQKNEAAAADVARDTERAAARLRAEADALTRVLAPSAAEKGVGPSMLSQLHVPPGFEAATAALFDGELATPLLPEGQGAAAGWIGLAPLAAAALPVGALPLAAEIEGPPALGRRLSHTGWVECEADGWRLQTQLAAGQSLVDRDGRLWRWDGFARPTPGSAATAERLRQRNRLNQLTAELETAEVGARRAGENALAARAGREAAAAAERNAIAALRAAEDRLARARAAEAELTRRSLAAETRLAGLSETIERLSGELGELVAQTRETDRALAVLPDPALARTALEGARAQATASRRRDSDARAALDRLAREAEGRRQRLASIAAEAAAWRKRHDGATAQRAILTERQDVLAAENAELAGRPAEIAAESEALARTAAAASAEEDMAAEALATGDARLRHATDASRQADAAVTEARERRAGLQARREAAAEGLARLRTEIAERLDYTPEELRERDCGKRRRVRCRGRRTGGPARPAGARARRHGAGQSAGRAGGRRGRGAARQPAARARRPVAAIARLRRGIAHARTARAGAAWKPPSSSSTGISASCSPACSAAARRNLAWTGDGDPLEAGLDIMASPPGKRLQALSLLSGGEQALTAIALIFSVFLTNPSPICVLDEVDAPLDDANVDRFCRLVADIADNTGTRFLVITHHRVTMARMDRLFGVTMAERGVSQLVSVDLARATELRQTA